MSEDTRVKFTPGPWDVDGNEVIGRKGRKIITDYGYEGLAWGGGDHPISDAEREANKRLIASAPDMYAMLEAFVHTPCQQPSRFAELQEQAKGILAQAAGETQANTDT